MKSLYTVGLLLLSNVFMTLAWYGHLQFKKTTFLQHAGLWTIIFISWGLAFFEYIFQVPANRIGSVEYGGPFSLFQLKIIQEVISLLVFTVFAIFVFKTDTFKWNYLLGFFFLVLAVYFIFKK